MDHWNYNYFPDDERDVEAEHRRRVLHQVNLRYRLRDGQDPFDTSVDEFKRLYRIPQHFVFELVAILEPFMPLRNHNIPHEIPLPVRVLSAIGFYAQGSYQRLAGRSMDIAVCQSSLGNCLREVTDALNRPEVLGRFIRFPMTNPEREATIRRNDRLGLPRVLGYIDGTLVQIVTPADRDNREGYRCRKGFNALNGQIVCDADLTILDVNSRFPGSCNDAYIYRHSGMREEMRQAYQETRCWLLGDSGYMEDPWLHLPLPRAERGTPEYHYTQLHTHCRNAVERCIGCLKARWRCLIDRALHYDPVKAGKIVNACAVLHNFCRLRNVVDPPLLHQQREEDEDQDNADADQEVGHMAELAQVELQHLINYAHEAHMNHPQ